MEIFLTLSLSEKGYKNKLVAYVQGARAVLLYPGYHINTEWNFTKNLVDLMASILGRKIKKQRYHI